MKTTFDTLPQQIDVLLAEVLNIKEILLDGIEKPEEVPKYLTLDDALLFLSKRAPHKQIKDVQAYFVKCNSIP